MDKLMTRRFRIGKKVKSLIELKSKLPIYGNAYHDMPIFQAVNRLLLEAKSTSERKLILDFTSNQVMGIKHKHTAEEVKKHLALLREESGV